jgi:hypothetical protein
MYSGAYPQSLFDVKFPKYNSFERPKEIFATPFDTRLVTNSRPLIGDS